MVVLVQDVALPRTLLAMIAALAIVAGCSLTPAASPASPGQAARERLVTDYLAALQRQDAGAVAAMVSPGVDATADIAAAMDQFGGVRLYDTRASWSDEFGGIYVVATVTGISDDGRAHEIRVPISRVAGDYYLALGQAAPSGSEANPASPMP